MKKFIFIPVVNRFDLLEKAAKSVNIDLYDEYIIFNNSEKEIPAEVYEGTKFKVLNPTRRMSFVETQNAMRSYAIENDFDFYSFMHNDGEILDDTDKRLIEYVENLNEEWGVVFTHYDVFCAFNTKAVRHIGEWGDIEWPQQASGYYLDCDYYRRLNKYGYKEKNLPDSNVSHFVSNTIKDPKESRLWDRQRDEVVSHYINKWGGTPGQEKYDFPYNRINRSSKVLVTGGAGFIGSNLVDRLLSLGHEVICIDNESASANEKFYWNPDAQNYKLDINEYHKIYHLFDKVDVVFHLASDARIQPSIADPKKSVDTNVLGTFNVLEASRRNNVGRVIFSSTSSAYGKNDIPNVETQKDDCLTPYSAAKVFGENLSKVYFNLYGLKTISLRYFNVYGSRQPIKGQYAPVIGLFLKQYKEDKPLTVVGDGTQRRDFTHVDDAVSANILAGFKDLDVSLFGQTYNVGYGKNYSILDIARMVSDRIEFIPERPGESKETLSDTNKIKTAFGWSATKSLEEWIRDNK